MIITSDCVNKSRGEACPLDCHANIVWAEFGVELLLVLQLLVVACSCL